MKSLLLLIIATVWFVACVSAQYNADKPNQWAEHQLSIKFDKMEQFVQLGDCALKCKKWDSVNVYYDLAGKESDEMEVIYIKYFPKRHKWLRESMRKDDKNCNCK